MPETVKRFPQSDGTTLVIDMVTQESWVEGQADQAVEDKPRVAPFATPTQVHEADVVELPKPAPTPDMTEQLAGEAERREPLKYPMGAPELKSLLRLRFSKRAAAMRLYQAAVDAWLNMPQQGTDLDSPDKFERYFGALDSFDQFLRCVSVNEEAYDSWVAASDDSEFAQLFFAYVERFGLGEASSSSS